MRVVKKEACGCLGGEGSKGNSPCKGPVAQMGVARWRNSQEARVAEAE